MNLHSNGVVTTTAKARERRERTNVSGAYAPKSLDPAKRLLASYSTLQNVIKSAPGSSRGRICALRVVGELPVSRYSDMSRWWRMKGNKECRWDQDAVLSSVAVLARIMVSSRLGLPLIAGVVTAGLRPPEHHCPRNIPRIIGACKRSAVDAKA